MNRNDKHAYFTQMSKSANEDLIRLAKRIEYIKTAATNLWPEEDKLIIRRHEASYADTVDRLERAQTWLDSNVQVPVELLKRQVERMADILLGASLPLSLEESGLVIIPANKKVTKTMLLKVAQAWHNGTLEIDPPPVRNRILEVLQRCKNQHAAMQPHG